MKILAILAVVVVLAVAVLFPRRRVIKHDFRLMFNGESPMNIRWFGSVVLLIASVTLVLIILLASLIGIFALLFF